MPPAREDFAITVTASYPEDDRLPPHVYVRFPAPGTAITRSFMPEEARALAREVYDAASKAEAMTVKP